MPSPTYGTNVSVFMGSELPRCNPFEQCLRELTFAAESIDPIMADFCRNFYCRYRRSCRLARVHSGVAGLICARRLSATPRV
jgi:hypothetical protein